MSDKITNSPQIRFAGFTDAWEQHKLGDLMEISSASRVHKDEWTKSGVPFFRSSDVVSEFKGTENNKAFISQSLFEKLSIKSGRVKNGDVLVTGGGSIGIPYLVKNDNPLYFKDADLLWLKSSEIINGTFLYTFFTTSYFRDYVNSITHIGTISHYTIEQAKVTPIRIPTKEEQTKIGDFFKLLDGTIALHQRELELLKDTKKSLLQKMFPKDGANVPEIRFAGFTDAWEQRELKELFVKGGSGGTPRSTNKDYYKGEIPFLGISDISNSNGYIDYTQKHISEEGLNNSSAWIVPKGAITLAMYASVGKIAILNVDVATSQAFYNMVFNDIIIRDFIYHRLVKANINEEWRELISTGTQSNLNAEKVKNFQIQLPKDKSEQSKIGQFFNQLDNLITLHQRELNSLKNLKKLLLQQMFI
jgi:type I restriction enzyme S subunit